jgi:hypothetical protein
MSAILFQYHEKHQYPIRGQILKPNSCVEPSPGLSENAMQMINLASKNCGASLTSKWRLFCVFHFTRFRYTRRFARTQPPCITRVTRTHTSASYSVTHFIHISTTLPFTISKEWHIASCAARAKPISQWANSCSKNSYEILNNFYHSQSPITVLMTLEVKLPSLRDQLIAVRHFLSLYLY